MDQFLLVLSLSLTVAIVYVSIGSVLDSIPGQTYSYASTLGKIRSRIPGSDYQLKIMQANDDELQKLHIFAEEIKKKSRKGITQRISFMENSLTFLFYELMLLKENPDVAFLKKNIELKEGEIKKCELEIKMLEKLIDLEKTNKLLIPSTWTEISEQVDQLLKYFDVDLTKNYPSENKTQNNDFLKVINLHIFQCLQLDEFLETNIKCDALSPQEKQEVVKKVGQKMYNPQGLALGLLDKLSGLLSKKIKQLELKKQSQNQTKDELSTSQATAQNDKQKQQKTQKTQDIANDGEGSGSDTQEVDTSQNGKPAEADQDATTDKNNQNSQHDQNEKVQQNKKGQDLGSINADANSKKTGVELKSGAQSKAKSTQKQTSQTQNKIGSKTTDSPKKIKLGSKTLNQLDTKKQPQQNSSSQLHAAGAGSNKIDKSGQKIKKANAKFQQSQKQQQTTASNVIKVPGKLQKNTWLKSDKGTNSAIQISVAQTNQSKIKSNSEKADQAKDSASQSLQQSGNHEVGEDAQENPATQKNPPSDINPPEALKEKVEQNGEDGAEAEPQSQISIIIFVIVGVVLVLLVAAFVVFIVVRTRSRSTNMRYSEQQFSPGAEAQLEQGRGGGSRQADFMVNGDVELDIDIDKESRDQEQIKLFTMASQRSDEEATIASEATISDVDVESSSSYYSSVDGDLISNCTSGSRSSSNSTCAASDEEAVMPRSSSNSTITIVISSSDS